MDRSELDITADLALMDLTDDERAALEKGVAQLLEYFSVMDSVDVTNLAPTTHALQEGNRLRADLPGTATAAAAGDLADELLEQAPDLEERFIAIPNVL
mgnify:CR=1 FL=1